MARDFKNITEAKLNDNKSKMKSKRSTKMSKSNAIPSWLWLVSGIVIGGFIFFIFYLKINVKIDETSSNLNETDSLIIKSPSTLGNQAKESEEANTAKKPEQEDSQSFEFYNILPNREVDLPEVKNEDQVKQNRKTIEEIKTKVQKSVPKNKDIAYIYTLQVGSFLRFKDADRHKANLGMLGIGSRIHAIKTKGKTHYRVLVGPYANIRKINEIDAVMKSNRIQTLLLREKG